MILLQNPDLPTPTAAIEIDAAIISINSLLQANLSWLSNPYGRAYKNIDASTGNTLFFPEVYLGKQNNSQRYINVMPDNDKRAQCFFYVTKENILNFESGQYGFLSYDVAIIFTANMELVKRALLETEIFQQTLVAQVRDVITRKTLGVSYKITLNSVDYLFENVFAEFNIPKPEQLEKAPFTHFRMNCNIILPEQCPTPELPS